MQKYPHIGVGVIIEKDGKVLLMQRINSHGQGTWSTPGGHLDFGESPEECAIREAKEETDVDVRNPRFRCLTNDIFEAEDRHYITIWMETEYLAGEPIINSEREMSAVGWFPWEALPEPLFLPLENLLAGKIYHPTGEK